MFTCRPTSMLVTNKALKCFLDSMYAFAQQIIISTKQKLIYPIQFQSLLVYLDVLTGIFLSRINKQWQESVFLFQTFLNSKCIKQIFGIWTLCYDNLPYPSKIHFTLRASEFLIMCARLILL